jgi:hypothetical protein
MRREEEEEEGWGPRRREEEAAEARALARWWCAFGLEVVGRRAPGRPPPEKKCIAAGGEV